ncbi:MAG: NADH-quinone oxidoreductase subunit C [Capsulimonadaceae bacterium]|nr:NADH-quinone oxidoreductase subunit C [Capsulimonadaceae bacterium]
MADNDVRLGLTPTDLALREITLKRPDPWVDLNADEDVELRVVQEAFAADVVKTRKFRDEKTLWIKPENVVAILTLLRDHIETQFSFLSDLTAVDLLKLNESDAEPRFQVVYNLYSMATFKRLRVNALVPDGESIHTVEGVWPAANWLEREVYDLMGITFEGHSDLRRIQLPDDWIGHPLRKDEPLGGEEVEFSFNVRGR